MSNLHSSFLGIPGTHIMGILNVTPDSFSGDGVLDTDVIVRRGLDMIQNGATILDVGGESSRPFADPVSIETEMERVVPVIQALSQKTDLPISIDTRHVETAHAAVLAGARIINDITGLQDERMISLAAYTDVHVVIMHMQGTPQNMQEKPYYRDVVEEVYQFLGNQAKHIKNRGIDPKKIILDPGIGFGKTLEHNIAVLRHLDRFVTTGYPVLVGTSRKSFIGHILSLPVNERLEGTMATVAYSIFKGARIIRVHDVKEIARMVKILDLLSERASFN